jgi:hypothetical protein
MNGNNKLIAAPLSKPQNVGGLYRMRGFSLDEEGGDGERSSMSFPEYCSESEGIVIEDSAIGFAGRSGEGEDILFVSGKQ